MLKRRLKIKIKGNMCPLRYIILIIPVLLFIVAKFCKRKNRKRKHRRRSI